jgi:AAA+ ATPase superfamily predicted ATPase
MLHNPFTPSEIASSPDDFFGRDVEMKTLERSLNQGSVAIQGAIGIGKSSLLARARLKMEGFDSDHQSKSVIAVCNKDVQTIDEMSQLVLEGFVSIDERQKKLNSKLEIFLKQNRQKLLNIFLREGICQFLNA